MNADPTGFDPQVTLDATAMMVMYNIYDTLVESDGACSSDIRPDWPKAGTSATTTWSIPST